MTQNKYIIVKYHLKQVQRALHERNECTCAPPILMPVSRELNSRALNFHKANKMRSATGTHLTSN